MSFASERVLHDLLRDRLELLGFHPIGCLSFSRRINGCKQLINVAARKEDNRLKFTCTLGIRFSEVESVLRPSDCDESYPTISCPIHLLHCDREFYEWVGSTAEELTLAVESMITEIHDVGSLFFNRFSTLVQIEEELSASPVSDYLILSQHQRIATLVAILLARGQRDTAKRLLDESLMEPQNQSPSKKRRLEELRAQLLA
jgi:hypothetical protein